MVKKYRVVYRKIKKMCVGMVLTLLHWKRPKLHTILASLSAIGLITGANSIFLNSAYFLASVFIITPGVSVKT